MAEEQSRVGNTFMAHPDQKRIGGSTLGIAERRPPCRPAAMQARDAELACREGV
jgi:hypothetical protein